MQKGLVTGCSQGLTTIQRTFKERNTMVGKWYDHHRKVTIIQWWPLSQVWMYKLKPHTRDHLLILQTQCYKNKFNMPFMRDTPHLTPLFSILGGLSQEVSLYITKCLPMGPRGFLWKRPCLAAASTAFTRSGIQLPYFNSRLVLAASAPPAGSGAVSKCIRVSRSVALEKYSNKVRCYNS